MSSEVFINAGLFGALMVFMLVLTATFLAFLYNQMEQWRETITALWDKQAKQRSEAMAAGLSDVQALTEAVKSDARNIRQLAQAIANHSNQAVHRHGQLMSELGSIKGQLSDRDYDSMIALIKAGQETQQPS